MNEERIWEQSRAWKHGRRYAALCYRHWQDNYKAIEDKLRATRGGFKARRKPPPPTPASISKANATKQAKLIKKWAQIMGNLGWSADTGTISNSVGTSSMCIYGSMNKLVKLGVMSREAEVRGKSRGRTPAVWTWIGSREL